MDGSDDNLMLPVCCSLTEGRLQRRLQRAATAENSLASYMPATFITYRALYTVCALGTVAGVCVNGFPVGRVHSTEGACAPGTAASVRVNGFPEVADPL